jgi:mannose-6-phosphate isomerase
VNLSPSRLAPIFVPRIWGARKLEPLFEAPTGPEPIGEVWLTGEKCAFASGPLAGRLLGEVWPSLPPEWTGTSLRNVPRVPLLVKFLFPEDKLSVQVHPNDDYARVRESKAGGVGKTEMWYVIAAREGAEIGLGFQTGVTRENFERAVADGNVEGTLRHLQVHPSECFFVPAGTPHMIGPGMVLCEIQQHSDITYRVFDFNRLQADGTCRPLHILQAMEVLDFGPPRGGQTAPVRVESAPLAKTYLVGCPYFATEKWDFSAPVSAATSVERFEILIVLSGRGAIESGATREPYGPAEVWLLPAALGPYRLNPESPTTLLRTYVPDLQALDQQLARENVTAASRSRLIHRYRSVTDPPSS